MTKAIMKIWPILGLLITVCFCCPVAMAEFSPLSDISSVVADIKVLTEITAQPYSQLIIRELGDGDLITPNYTDDGKNNGALPDMVRVKYEGSGMFGAYECPVLWDYSSIDINKAGVQKIKGKLTLLEGEAVFSAELTDEINHIVFFTTEGEIENQLELATAEYSMTSPLMLEKGGDPSSLDLLYKTGACTVMPWDGKTLGIAYTMHYSGFEVDSIDSNIFGLQQLSATPILANGINLPNGESYVKVPVAIIDPDKIDFGGAVLNQDNTAISAQWIYKAREPIQPQYRIGEGEWINDTEFEWGGWKFSGYNNWSNGISINLFQIPLKTDYYFRILYDGKASDILHIYIDEYNFKIDPNAGGGDNDGGDRDETEMPDIAQPPPSYAPDNSGGITNDSIPAQIVTAPVVKPFMESVTDTKTILSGARVKHLLLANPNYLLFEKQGVSLELTNELLSAFKLADDDKIEVSIEKSTDNLLSIKMIVNGKDIFHIPKTLLFLPWTWEEIPELIHIDSGEIFTASIEGKVLKIGLDKTGDYEIRKNIASLPPVATAAPATPANIQPIEPENEPESPVDKSLERDTTAHKKLTANNMALMAIAIVVLVISVLVYRAWRGRHDKK